MSSIADSSAVLEKKRLLSQHQAALTLIQGQVVKPNITKYCWLDLCCGKGQIIINLEDNFSQAQREKIEYHIQDINEEYLKVTQRNAQSLKFKKVESYTTDITTFHNVVPAGIKQDFITIINAIHEIPTHFIPQLLYECVIRLSQNGVLYLYDMETVNPLELGAVTWTREEIQEIINSFTLGITKQGYIPNANRWHHSSCNAWSVEIQNEFLVSLEEISQKRESILQRTQEVITNILKRKKESCQRALESYTKFGTETPEDETKKVQLLYEFYSLNRILQ